MTRATREPRPRAALRFASFVPGLRPDPRLEAQRRTLGRLREQLGASRGGKAAAREDWLSQFPRSYGY